MKPLHTSILLGVILICAGFGLYLRNVDLGNASVRLSSIKTEGPGYSSRPLDLSPFEKEILGEAEVLKRLYVWRGQRFVITVIDGSKNRHAIHDPRYCFRGAGWEIRDEREVPFGGGEARRLTLEKDSVSCQALFFYSTGDSIFSSPLQYWFKATLRRWTRGQSSAEPVLVMFQSLDPGGSIDQALSQFLPLIQLP